VGCLTPGTSGYLGDVGPLILTAPTTVNTDVSLKRSIPIKYREGMLLQLSADVFNVFNRANLAPPASSTAFQLASGVSGTSPTPTFAPVPTAGVITATIGSSRQFQIGVRMLF
jgi:hypothetical protein